MEVRAGLEGVVFTDTFPSAIDGEAGRSSYCGYDIRDLAAEATYSEATHGTAPKYTDQDMANPGSLLFSAVMMLEYLGWSDIAQAISDAYVKTVAQRIVTYDFARLMEGATQVGTAAFATALIGNL
jgi:isocitrate dehydrogenase